MIRYDTRCAMRLLAILTVVCINHTATAQIAPRSETNPVVSSFSVSGTRSIQALLQLAQSEGIPIGIVVGDDQLCSMEISYSAQNAPALQIAEGIISSLRGYRVRMEQPSQVIVVTPVNMTVATQEFLSLMDDRYMVRGNTQTLATMLWVHIRAILYPDQGTAGSILGSPDDAVSELDLKNASVERILNRIAIRVKGAWVLRPLPTTLSNLGPQRPFHLFTKADGTPSNITDLCSRVPESGSN